MIEGFEDVEGMLDLVKDMVNEGLDLFWGWG